jgi:hypothetical protein
MSKQPTCSYNTLDTYNGGKYTARAPIPSGTPDMRVQTVPVYPPMSYDTLSNGGKTTCGGYYTIVDGYPSYDQKCTQFSQRLCANNQ